MLTVVKRAHRAEAIRSATLHGLILRRTRWVRLRRFCGPSLMA
jgi:hypothetical protein